MSLTPETTTVVINNFAGSTQAIDSYDVDPTHGFLSQNVDFILGQPFTASVGVAGSVQASTRRGTSQLAQIPNGAGAITTIASWYFSFNGVQNCYVAMYSPAIGLFFYNQTTGTFSGAIIAVTGAAYVSVALNGSYLYAAFGDSTGLIGTSVGYVYGIYANGTFTNPAVDVLFAPPLPQAPGYSPSPPLPNLFVAQNSGAVGSGVITAGQHRFGYVLTTRNGYTGALGPLDDNTGLFSPNSFIAAANQNLVIEVAAPVALPTYLLATNAPTPPTVQIVMTSAANLSEYYLVPGAAYTLPVAPFTTTSAITISITDADLVTGTNVTQLQNLLIGTGAIVPSALPFQPSALFIYSSRMGYVTRDSAGFPVVYFSDPNAYQVLNAAFYGIYLEGRQIPVQGCSVGSVCYISTLSALYAVQDNGGLPATWTQPSRVAGSVGILAPSCIKAVGGKVLLASEKGLYIFYGGTFPQVPVSYWQSADWNRINWLAPTQVQVIDDAFDHVIRVIAPLKVVVTSASNTNPIVVTTAILVNNVPVAYPHNFQTGLSVTIAGVAGNTSANTTQNITVTGANTFTIPVAGNGAYTGGGIATPNSPNAEMAWWYPQGDSPGQTFYSLNAFTAFRQGAIAAVRNIATNEDEPWYAPSHSNTGGLIRRVLPTDPVIYQDVDLSGSAAAIASTYETSFVPGSTDDSCVLHDYVGMHLRASGLGSLAITAYGLDHVVSVVPAASPVTITQAPGKEYRILWYLRSEQQSISFTTNAIGAYFILALVKAYYQNSLPMR